MNKSEKLILKSVVDSLEKTTNAGWETGYLDDWSTWARKMQRTIITSVPVMNAMMSDEIPEPPIETPMTVAEIVDAIERLRALDEDCCDDELQATIKELCNKLKGKS